MESMDCWVKKLAHKDIADKYFHFYHQQHQEVGMEIIWVCRVLQLLEIGQREKQILIWDP